MKDLNRNQKGFTLVELLVAMTIFAIGLLSVAGMQITALKANSSANTLTAATALAEGVLEQLLARSPIDPLLNSDSAAPINFGSFQYEGAGTYTASYAVDADYNGVSNISKVTVVVTGGGRTLGGASQRTISLTGFKRTI